MKILFNTLRIGLLLAMFIATPLWAGTVYASTVQDNLRRDAQCQGGDSLKCLPEPADPTGLARCTDNNCNVVKKYVDPLIVLLSAMVGIAVVIGVVWGGIQYASSAGDPQKVASAKKKIRNSILALIMFFFLIALLRFLVPGDLISMAHNNIIAAVRPLGR